ncbi:MAG: hypothetical protein HDR88_04165 [Bacteroides sp.]|nr:hypothetical protein [Bacteroides sp.]
MKRIVTYLLFSSVVTVAVAQINVSGRVIDIDNNESYSYENTTRKKFLELCRYRYDNIQGISDWYFGGNGPRLSQ